jgi:hypothetical protein
LHSPIGGNILQDPPPAGMTLLLTGSHIVIDQAYEGNVRVASTGATLLFKSGGKFKNGTLQGNQVTLVFENPVQCVFENVMFNGTFLCPYFHPEQFGAVGDGTTDDTLALQYCLIGAVDAHVNRVVLQPKTYLVTDTLYYKGNLTIEGNCFSSYYHEQSTKIKVKYGGATFVRENLDDSVIFKFAIDRLSGTEPCTFIMKDVAFVNMKKTGENEEIINIMPGGVRLCHTVNSKLSGVTFSDFLLPMEFCNCNGLKVERVLARRNLWGTLLNEVHNAQFTSVQLMNSIYDANSSILGLYFINDGSTTLREFFLKLFKLQIADFLEEYAMLYYSGDIDNVELLSINCIGHDSYATFSACTVESSHIGIIANNSRFTWDLPYIEGVKKTIAIANKSVILLNRSVGSQSSTPTNHYAYAAIGLESKLVLTQCPLYSNYQPTLQPNTEPDPETPFINFAPACYRIGEQVQTLTDEQNRLLYNIKPYVVIGLPKNSPAYRHQDLYYSFIDADVGDTLYITSETSGNSLDEDPTLYHVGSYSTLPLSLRVALYRIANDWNYRHVTRLVAIRDHNNFILSETLVWKTPGQTLTVFDASFTVNAPQIICCNVVFTRSWHAAILTLYTHFCQTCDNISVSLKFDFYPHGNYYYLNNYSFVNNTNIQAPHTHCNIVKVVATHPLFGKTDNFYLDNTNSPTKYLVECGTRTFTNIT